MLSLERVMKSRRRVAQALTGFTGAELASLVGEWGREMARQAPGWTGVSADARQRKRGAGKRPQLGAEDALLLVLVYFRVYPTQDLLALLFGGTQAWACKWVHRLTPVLEAVLGEHKALPVRPQKRIGSLEELLEYCPELTFIIDGTERPVQRPKDKEAQRARYSGKKKRHTRKHTVISHKATGRIVALGDTYDGSVHDKRMADADAIAFPKGSIVYQDTGYEGYSPPGEQLFCLQPRKKARGKPRTEADKAFNRLVSQSRVRVEHAIGGAKRARIAADVFRNRMPGFDDTAFYVACGLHNFRASSRKFYASA